MKFYLGTHKPHWLHVVDCPLFVSRRRLACCVALPRARCRWALDSGGFSELTLFGEWRTSPAKYAEEVQRYSREIGELDFAAQQDWMCEPHLLAKTGLTVNEHQRRTVRNLLELRELAPDMPFIPVLQGWEPDDYLRHWEMWHVYGVDLEAEPLVGMGSICRRQATGGVEELVRHVSKWVRLHGFGLKLNGLGRLAPHLQSSDSMAWSFRARNLPPMRGHTHKACVNCVHFAWNWRYRVRALTAKSGAQLHLFD